MGAGARLSKNTISLPRHQALITKHRLSKANIAATTLSRSLPKFAEMSISAHWESRPALRQGSLVSLGDLYDAHSESILHRSFLKTNALPPGCVGIKEAPGLFYKHATTDSLEEKFSSLDISAELGLSALCGRLKGGWCCEYLSRRRRVTAFAKPPQSA